MPDGPMVRVEVPSIRRANHLPPAESSHWPYTAPANGQSGGASHGPPFAFERHELRLSSISSRREKSAFQSHFSRAGSIMIALTSITAVPRRYGTRGFGTVTRVRIIQTTPGCTVEDFSWILL